MPAKKPARLNAPASHSDTLTSTPILAHNKACGVTGRCKRMSASSLLKSISPEDAARNIPRKTNVIACK